MRPARIALLVCLLSLSTSGWAQQSLPPAPQPAPRDPQAVAAVQAAITAFGTSASAQSLQAQGQTQDSGPSGNVTTLTLEMAGSEFRIAASDGKFSSVIATGYGNPKATVDGHVQAVPKHVVQAIFIPAFAGVILAREFQNPQYSLRYLGAEMVNGTPCTAVRTVLLTSPENAAMTDQIWYFSNATNLPVRVIYRSPADQTPLLSRPETVDLSNFTSVQGGLYPFSINLFLPYQQVATTTLRSVNPNANIPSADFDAPAGGVQ